MTNINREVLNSFFIEKNVWLERLEYLEKDYQTLSEKILHYQNIKNEFPSKAIIRKSIPKFIVGDSPENIKLRKKLDSIMSSLLGEDETEFTISELQDLIEEEYKKGILADKLEKAVEAISSGNFNLVSTLSENMISICASNAIDVNKYNTKDAIKNIELANNEVSTGLNFGLNTGAEKCTKGSVILITGASGAGKSQLDLTAFVTDYLSGLSTCQFNYELDFYEITLRIKSFISKVPQDEIKNGEYSCSDNAIRVQAVDYVLDRVIDIEKATSILVKGDLGEFEKYPLRENKFTIFASKGDHKFKSGFDDSFEELEELPTDVELLKFLDKYGKEYDSIHLDLITELEFENPTSGGEANDIKLFVKKAKKLAKKYSFRFYVLNQVQDETSAYGLFEPKYSKALRQTADLHLVVVATNEMIENNEVAIAIKKCRYGIPNQVIMCNAKFEISTFEPTGDIIWLSELQKDLAKQFSSKKDK